MTLEQINQKYKSLCVQVGDAEYKIRQHKSLIKSLYSEIDKLNELAAELQSSKSQDSKSSESKKS